MALDYQETTTGEMYKVDIKGKDSYNKLLKTVIDDPDTTVLFMYCNKDGRAMITGIAVEPKFVEELSTAISTVLEKWEVLEKEE